MAGRSTRVLLLLLGVAPGMAGAQQPLESHTTPASTPGAAIPVAEVATQATEVATLLRTVRTEVSPGPALATIHTGLPEVSATIDLELAATSTVLQGQPTLAVLGWVVRSLSDVGLWEPVLALGSTVLTATLERGTIHLSVGDVLAFGLTVLGASLLSTLLRFVLDEDIYPRTGITTGQAYAVSTLLHYGLLALGFLGGLGLLGMDLTRVTVLVGALGVGIGFGVQSVVNNLALRPHLTLRAPDPGGRCGRAGGAPGGGASHWPPGQRGAHRAGGRHHRPQCGFRHQAGDQLDAHRPAAADRPVGGRELWGRAPARGRPVRDSGPVPPAGVAGAAPRAFFMAMVTAPSPSHCAPGRTMWSTGYTSRAI